MALNVIKVEFELGHYQIDTFIRQIETTPDADRVPAVQAKVKAASGLSELHAGRYQAAAKQFLETGFDIQNSYSEVISAQDVAIYGALCALASFDRDELLQRVIENTEFRQFLELVPQVRELISQFHQSRYSAMFNTLDKLRPDLMLDMHLREHIAALYEGIRKKALIQYVLPFVSIDLRKMSEAFQTGVEQLEEELTTLIISRRIHARIDSHRKVLHASQTDHRALTFQRAMAVGQAAMADTHLLINRINLLRADLVVRPEDSEQLKQ